MRTTLQKILSSQKNCWLVVCTTKVNVSAVFLYIITMNGQILICQVFIIKAISVYTAKLRILFLAIQCIQQFLKFLHQPLKMEVRSHFMLCKMIGCKRITSTHFQK